MKKLVVVCVILCIFTVIYLLTKVPVVKNFSYTVPTPVNIVVQKCLLDNGIIVYGQKKKMIICQDKQVLYDFNVLLGSGGLGKNRRGDLKTPIGVYALGKPRQSRRLGTFIPIQYPTIDQLHKGFSGSAIGIHGPHRLIKWSDSLRFLDNSTHGCIVLEKDEQVMIVVKWLQTHKYMPILIAP